MQIPPPPPEVRCRLEWGRRGAATGAARGDILVIVDVLSFSSAVVTATERGASVYPCADGESETDRAHALGAEAAVHRNAVPAEGRYSLSPLSFLTVTAGERVVLASPNGATCSRHAREAPAIICGALLNRSAVATSLRSMLSGSDRAVTVVACGERWEEPAEEGRLRFAIEDYLGAGAIIAALGVVSTAEATLAARAFESAAGELPELLHLCDSGRELDQKGYRGDVEHAARVDLYAVVPVLREGRFEGGGVWEV
jgi:2-phosphosulfolactate phosphatase